MMRRWPDAQRGDLAQNKARLYRYTRSESDEKTPVLCIMPLINRAYILIRAPVRASLRTFVAGSRCLFARLGRVER